MNCSICEKPIDVQTFGDNIWAGGHNAWPINEGRCCTNCNNMFVIPARLDIVLSQQKKGQSNGQSS